MRPRTAFTLIELLVVVAVIALLTAILAPSLGRAKQMAVTAHCLSNLRQDGTAMVMYATECNGMLPYPTTTLDEQCLWFTAIDPYLGAHAAAGRTGVAADRAYMAYKQCPLVAPLLGSATNYGGTGAQNTTTEYTRSYKMNAMLRHHDLQARISSVKSPCNFVALGDGIAIDMTGDIPTQWENGQFSMEIDDPSQANPSLRHLGGACIVFVDGHAEREVLGTITKHLRSPQDGIVVKSWPGEYLLNGSPYNPSGGDPLPAGVSRNGAMPLQWSEPEILYR